jgi:hypothetical protein
VTAVEATTSVARLKLDTSPDALGDAASLSRREKECCAFFDFAIDVNAEVPWLVVSVPAAAGEALSGFLDVLAAP